MADSSPARAALKVTPENKNFFHLAHLLISGGTHILREVFDSIHPPSTLPAVIGNTQTKNNLKKCVHYQPQWKCLYPSEGCYGKSTDFDISLLSVLLRHICKLQYPQSGPSWDTLPAPTAKSVSDDLVRVKHYRNTLYAHTHNMAISTEEMRRLWEEISEVLGRLAGSLGEAKAKEWQQAMAQLKEKAAPTQDAIHCAEKLETWYNTDEVKELKGKVQVLRKDVETLKKQVGDLSSQKEASSAAQGKECDFLPKSYHYFVNREAECEKIKSLLPIQSPRRTNLIFIHGPPGMGKTSTAVKVANDLEKDGWNIFYVNCRPMRRLDELAHKIVNKFTPLPSDKPIAEARQRLYHQTETTLLVLDNFETLLHPEEGDERCQSSQPDTQSLTTNRREDVLQFVSDIGNMSENVAILITSRELKLFPDLVQESIRLYPLSDEHSLQLLEYLGCKRDEQKTEEVLKSGEGTPLMLHTLASLPSDTIRKLSKSPAGHVADFLLCLMHLPDEKNVIKCVIQSFERLQPVLQNVLVQLAIFKGPFTMQRAKHILDMEDDQKMEAHLINLINQSLLVHHSESPRSPYSLLSAIREVCALECKEDRRLQQISDGAKRRFILHYKRCLEELFKGFYSRKSLEAIESYREEEENIKQLLYWCAEDPSMDDTLRKECVDTFNSVGELLAKLIRRNEFERIFTKLATKCQGDERRVAECKISMGIKIIFSCSCSPNLCVPAKNRAKAYFREAMGSLSKPTIADNSRAQCLSKLGRCCALEGNFKEGKSLIDKALGIRLKVSEEDPVMLAATYNDLAVAQTLNKQHKKAIDIRRQCTLKVYKGKLGDHPFTATILNNIGNNHHELEEFTSAISSFEKALEIRRNFLSDHQDTAKSLYDLGIAYKAQGSPIKALQNIQEAASMLEKVSDTKEEQVKVYRQLVDVLKKLGKEDEAKSVMEKVRKCDEALGSRGHLSDVCCTSTDETWKT